MGTGALASSALVLDTSALYAFLNRKDPDHAWVKEAIRGLTGPFVLPVAILAEVTYLVERRMGYEALMAFLQDVEDGYFLANWNEQDLPSVRTLVRQHQDLPLGFSDAAIAVAGLSLEVPVLTLDAHFLVLARGEGLRVVHPNL